MARTWTSKDINVLLTLSSKQKTVQKIAKRLNRTPASIKKALWKFNAQKSITRQNNQPKTTNFSIHAHSKSFIEPCQQENTWKKNKNQDNEWVSFEELIDFLNTNGYQINLRSQKSTVYRLHSFSVNSIPRTYPDLLILANRLRQEKNLSTLYVFGVTL
jgi:DNA-binding MarR family transcriptional regulator